MSCKLKEIIDIRKADEASKTSHNQNLAKELLEKLVQDCSCLLIKTTKVHRTWKRLWIPQYEVVETVPTFKINEHYKHCVDCEFGDLHTHISCNEGDKSWSKYNIGGLFGNKQHITYESLLLELSNRIYNYTTSFQPGQKREYL